MVAVSMSLCTHNYHPSFENNIPRQEHHSRVCIGVQKDYSYFFHVPMYWCHHRELYVSLGIKHYKVGVGLES